jgi:hypothetical protein
MSFKRLATFKAFFILGHVIDKVSIFENVAVRIKPLRVVPAAVAALVSLSRSV